MSINRIYLYIRNHLNLVHSLFNAFLGASDLDLFRALVSAGDRDLGGSSKFKVLKFLALLSKNKTMVFPWNPDSVTGLKER